MDSLISAAIGALSAIFVSAFIVVILLICRRHNKHKNFERFDESDRSTSRKKKKRPEPELAMALGDMGLQNALDQILNDEQWVDDATGLVPHCLSVLKTCHSLTEKLANLAMGPSIKNPADRLIDAAKRIPSRVDDVVQAMYPPLDPRLLEARCAALALAVGQLALLTQSIVGSHKAWIDQSIQAIDKDLLILRKAAFEIDQNNRSEFLKHSSSYV